MPRRKRPVGPQPEVIRDVTTSTIQYTDEQRDFLAAMDAYMRINDRRFPTLSEVLAVAKSIGYRKVEEATLLPVFRRLGDTKET